MAGNDVHVAYSKDLKLLYLRNGEPKGHREQIKKIFSAVLCPFSDGHLFMANCWAA